MVILAAIIALAAGGLIVVMLAIAHDDSRTPRASSDASTRPRVTIRRGGGMPAFRRARPVTAAIEASERERKPPRRSMWRQWRAHHLAQLRARFRWSLDKSEAKMLAAGIVCSVALA